MVLFTTVVFGFIMRIWHKFYDTEEELVRTNSLSQMTKDEETESSDVDVYTHPSHHDE